MVETDMKKQYGVAPGAVWSGSRCITGGFTEDLLSQEPRSTCTNTPPQGKYPLCPRSPTPQDRLMPLGVNLSALPLLVVLYDRLSFL